MYEKIYENSEMYIYKIFVPLPNNPLKNLNCYVIITEEKNLIIDTGFNMRECYDALKQGLEELEIDMNKTAMFLTHLHADHTGLVGDIANDNTTIYMSKIDYEYYMSMTGTYRNDVNDTYVSEGFPKEELDILTSTNPAKLYVTKNLYKPTTFEDGIKFNIGNIELTCIMTPGHTPGHACLYIEKEKIMFLGDHILFDISPNICRWKGVNNSLKDYISSLKKIRGFEIKTALPAHRLNDMDVYERIDQLLKHHQVRLSEIFECVKNRPGLTSYEIASHMKWSVRGKDWGDIPVFQKWFATGETLSHLDYLIEDGKIIKKTENGIYRYYIG